MTQEQLRALELRDRLPEALRQSLRERLGVTAVRLVKIEDADDTNSATVLTKDSGKS